MTRLVVSLALALLLPASPAAAGDACTLVHGGVIRGPREARRLALVFTGDTFAEGGTTILDVLAARRAPAGFFLTGNFLRVEAFAPLVRRMVAEGHLVGPHSDRHLLYADWTRRDRTLVTREAFARDLRDNLRELERFGVPASSVRVWVPPFEWWNAEVAAWSAAFGVRVFGFSPGTRANADYTGERDTNFVSSDAILASVLAHERDDPHGLNGAILLMHVGAGPGRRDKLHDRLGGLLDELRRRGYAFERVDRLLETCP